MCYAIIHNSVRSTAQNNYELYKIHDKKEFCCN